MAENVAIVDALAIVQCQKHASANAWIKCVLVDAMVKRGTYYASYVPIRINNWINDPFIYCQLNLLVTLIKINRYFVSVGPFIIIIVNTLLLITKLII